MKTMCDTNVILDVLLEREPFAKNSCKFLSLCEEHRIDGFVSASSVTDIYYLVRKYTHSTGLAYKSVGNLLEIVKVCSVTNDDVLTALQRKAKDFEDCLVATCAKSTRCDYIVTRYKKTLKNLTFHCSHLRNSYSNFHDPKPHPEDRMRFSTLSSHICFPTSKISGYKLCKRLKSNNI